MARVALVTGGQRGIGAAISEGLQQARQQARAGFGAQIKARGQRAREHGKGPVQGGGACKKGRPTGKARRPEARRLRRPRR